MATINCFSCGKDITTQPANRYQILSQASAKAIPAWKKLISESFSDLGFEINADQLLSKIEDVGKLCHHCVSNLCKFHKLNSTVHENMKDAVNVS
jgi:DNA-directed RNA polymerase subunit N (RpoN/RPB10)